ncbi:MAG TPA: hypothetical protein VF593_08235 [Chthoniobacteraceae bacterium]|jgi:hypothetical protein
MAKPPDKKPEDQRAKALANVWGFALVMLVVCVPLCAMFRTAVIPLTIIAGAAVVTLYIWSRGEKDSGVQDAENESLRTKIQELEERLANVEVINRFEDRLAEKELRRTAADPSGAPEESRAAAAGEENRNA